MAYTPIPQGGAAVGSPVGGGTANRFLTTDENGNIETDDAFQADVNDRIGFGSAPASGWRMVVSQASGDNGVRVNASVNTNDGNVFVQNSQGRIIALRAYGDAQATTVGGASAAQWTHLYGNNSVGMLIGSTDGVPTKFLAGNNADRAAVSGILSVAFTPAGNVGAGEDTLQSFSVKANTLNTNGQAVWIAARVVFAANANSKQVRVRFGGTLVYDSGAQGQSGGQMHIFARVTRTSATTQIAEGFVTNTAAAPLFLNAAINASPGETLSGAVAFSVTGEATSNDDITATARWGWEAV